MTKRPCFAYSCNTVKVQRKKKISRFAERGLQCYDLAKERLYKEYGRPWIVAEACERYSEESQPVKAGSAKQLKDFFERLEKAAITLQDIQHYGSLNSLDSLTNLVNKLPFDMRRRWVKLSVEIETRTRVIATFVYFVKFVERESHQANSVFGLQSFGSTNSNPSNSKSKLSSCTTLATTKDVSNSNACCFCNSSQHKLLDCANFLKTSVQERFSFVKSKKLCCKCLSSKHRTLECKRSGTCTVSGCKGSFHHTLLHKSHGNAKPLRNTNDVSTSVTEEIVASTAVSQCSKAVEKLLACT